VSDLRQTVRAWLDEDPDSKDRTQLQRLLDDPAPAARSELADRFAARLSFGTAGLRGAVGAGPNRMNRAVVRAATAALAGWLVTNRPGSEAAGVVIGCDARHGSAEFADETVGVLTGAGFRVHTLPRQRPTPLLAYAVPHLGAAAGVMITASHNPREDNGYKLYLDDGAQIIPPVDAEIETGIDELGPLSGVPVGDLAGPLVVTHDTDVVDAYLDAIAAASPAPEGAGAIRIVYTPLHGVACEMFLAALERAGFPPPHVVAAQSEPDPDFPTVTFPNPEEPGALDLAMAEARQVNADLVVANDPDGDRLAVGVPDPSVDGGWRILTGDQLGSLLGAHLLAQSANDPHPHERLVVTTIVSSRMLSKIAAAAGVRYAATLTGFKWIVRAGQRHPGSRFILGYEEALGYAVGDVVRDKDGIGAALATLGLATLAHNQGTSMSENWDDLETRFGVHRTAQLSLRQDAPFETMARLRRQPLAELAGIPVSETLDLAAGSSTLPASDVLIYRLPGARLVIRPSGTEPKLKAYLEVVAAVSGDLAGARRLATAEIGRLRRAVASALGS
jgi:phosphomannomutase